MKLYLAQLGWGRKHGFEILYPDVGVAKNLSPWM